jgi:YVTN family beta-propeller protein
MKKINMLFIAITLIVIAASCKKNDVQTTINTSKDSTGLYVLNQGNLGHNNTTLTFYNLVDSLASSGDYFKNVNGFSLGDAGSDFIIYGGKMYIVMNNSGYVAVVNPSNAKFIDSISFINGGVNRGPENIVAYQNNVFVSSTDGNVAVIDTASLAISKFIPVGTNPAQMAISGTNLYVSNSGGYSPPPFDSTLSVINLNTLTVTQTIVVGTDPGYIAADNSGNVFVACAGDYTSLTNLPTFVKVNTATNTVTQSAALAVSGVRFYNNYLYAIVNYSTVELINPGDLSVASASFISDGTTVTTPYGIDIDGTTGDVYVDDAKDYSSNGEVFCFDKNGVQKFSFSVSSANPCKVVLK